MKSKILSIFPLSFALLTPCGLLKIRVQTRTGGSTGISFRCHLAIFMQKHPKLCLLL